MQIILIFSWFVFVHSLRQLQLLIMKQKRLIFAGEIIQLNSTMIQVNLKLLDDLYPEDPQYFEFIQNDDIKIFKLQNFDDTETAQVFDTEIIHYENQTRQFRQYSFLLTLQELETELIKTENTNQYVYKGCYQFVIYAAKTDKLKYPFYFEIAIIVDKFKDIIVETAFRTFSFSLSLDHFQLVEKDKTTLYWCKNFSCDEYSLQTPDIHINDEIVLLQYFLSDYYLLLNDTEVWYTSDGLYKKANILKIDNQNRLRVKILLKADIAWNNFTITVVLKKVKISNKEHLKIYQQVLGSSDLIECVKREQSEDCLTCQEQCDINGYAQLSCNSCNQFNLTQILLMIFVILLLFGFVRKYSNHQKKKKEI